MITPWGPAGAMPPPTLRVGETRARVLRATIVPLVIVLCLIAGSLWFLSRYGGTALDLVVGAGLLLLLGGAGATIYRLVHPLRCVLVLDPVAVTLVQKRITVPYRDIGLVLTWRLHSPALDIGPHPYLAVVPRSHVAAVLAAGPPRIPSLGGRRTWTGAPHHLNAFTMAYHETYVVSRDVVVTELARRAPHARVAELGDITHS